MIWIEYAQTPRFVAVGATVKAGGEFSVSWDRLSVSPKPRLRATGRGLLQMSGSWAPTVF